MTVRELYGILNDMISPSLSCAWDNDGLMCCPDGEREVKKVLITLDVTARAVDAAIEGGYDLIVAHHPMIFKGLSAVHEEQYVARKVIRLIRAGVSVMSFHTRLDAVSGGVNDTLCALLGIEDARPFGEEAIGRIGTLPREMTLEDFAAAVKKKLNAPAVFAADGGRPVRRVAVLGGSGGDDIGAAFSAGADTYLSGNLGYHALTDAPEQGMNLIEAGHFFTEQPVCETLKQVLLTFDPELCCDLFYSDRILCI